MWRTTILAGAVLAAVLPVSSGQVRDEPSSPSGTGASPTTRAFAASPIVERASDTFQVTVRLNRPLPATGGAGRSGLALPATASDLRGPRRLTSTTDCYQQDLFKTDDQAEWLMPGSAPGVGERATVRFAIGTSGTITTTAPAEQATDWSARHDKKLARRLGCHRPAQVRRCAGAFRVMDMTLKLRRTSGGASCASGRRVFRAVKEMPWASSCNPRLCLSEGYRYAGFRCHMIYGGEHAWRVVCQRGRAEIVGSVAY